MKKLNYIWGALAVMTLSVASCSPDDIEGLSEAGIPLASEAQVTVSVDQTTNQATFSLAGEGVYPVWIMTWESANPYSTVNGYTKIVNSAGDYVLNYRVGNRNGISQGMGSTTFHIDNSLVNFDMYTALLSGKNWRIDSSVQGHMGCGPTDTDGLGWWSAAPDDKAGTGVYDDIVTFGADGTYTYSPGEDGLTYINWGCSLYPEYNVNGEVDFDAPTSAQTATYSIVGEGDDVYLVLAPNTLFPYIPNDEQYANPRFRIESISGSRLVLVNDNGTIAWHYILTSAEAEKTFDGFDADHDCNLFKTCQFTNTYYYAPGWAQIADPTLTVDGNSYTLSLPDATTDQWQAQCFFHTDMATNAANNYDFSCKLMSTTDHNSVTVKLVKADDANTFYFTDVVQLKAYEEYVLYHTDMPGIDMDNVDIVFDFGGNAAGTDVTISNIVLKEHSCDDGTEAPAEGEGEGEGDDNTVYTYDADTNLWKVNVDDTDNYSTFFFYAPGWQELPAPEFTGTGGVYNVKLPQATFDQWQAQVHLITQIPGEADTPYDFSCTLMSSQAINGATVKLTQDGDDNNYFFTERVNLNPYEEYVLKVPAKTLLVGAAPTLKLVFDFGGNPENTEVTVSNIILQKTAQ